MKFKIIYQRRRYLGFTLVEMVIAVILVSILAIIGSELLLSGMLTTFRVNQTNSTSAAARYAIERLSREIREVQIVGDQYQITAAQPASISFLSSIGQGASGDATTVTFNSGTKTLTMTKASAGIQANPLVSNVTAFSFTYYNSQGSITTNLGDIRSVQINMTVKTTDSPPIALSSLVVFRNQL